MLSAPDFEQKKIIVALLSHGDRLNFKNDNIIISDENGIRHQSSCYRLFALFVVGHITITSGLLQRAKKFGFSIVLMTHGLIPYGSWLAQAEGNVLLRRKQYEYQGLDIARHLMANKIGQQIEALKQRRKKSPELKAAIANLQEYNSRLPDADLDLQGVLGIEGIASRVYFSHMFDMVEWNGRKPRAKRDIPNLLLDIGYTQLFHFMDALLNLYGAGMLRQEKLSAASESEISNLIIPSGYYNQKTRKIKEFVKQYPTLKRRKTVDSLRDFLLTIRGLGPETADSIVLYAFKKPVFVVDAYTKRFCAAHNLPVNGYYDDYRNYFEKNLRSDYRIFNEYHALIVRWGKDNKLK